MPGELGDTEEGIEGATPSRRGKEFVRVGWAPPLYTPPSDLGHARPGTTVLRRNMTGCS